MIELIGFVALGVISGVIASTMGVGGGVVFIPSLVVIFGFSQHVAQGTSLAIMVPTAVVGTIMHARRGRVQWRYAGTLAIGGVIGALAGSQLALTLDPTVLQRLFAALLVFVAVRMLSK